MIVRLRTEIQLPGPPRGLGVDLVAVGRVSERVADRCYSPEERAAFSRDLPFAVREAVIKAVGGVGIPGAPLREMVVERAGGRLRFVPGERYLLVLRRKAVREVSLEELALAPSLGLVGVVAVACGEGEPRTAALSVVIRDAEESDDAALDEAERASIRDRYDPRPSRANRVAAREAAALLGMTYRVRVEGGGSVRPELVGGPRAFLSLGHEGMLGVAAILLRDDG